MVKKINDFHKLLGASGLCAFLFLFVFMNHCYNQLDIVTLFGGFFGIMGIPIVVGWKIGNT